MPNKCSRQSSYGTLLFGLATVYAAVGCVLILGVCVPVTMISAAAQPSSGVATSRSPAPPRSAPRASLPKGSSGSRSAPLPNFDELPHRSVPAAGVFQGWCGNQDRCLIWDGRGASSRLFDPTSPDAGVQITMSGPRQCDGGGDNIVFVISSRGAIARVNVEQRSMETLALYQQLHASKPPILSISPDLKSVAYDPERVRFNDESGGANIKLLPLIAGEGQHTGVIRWKADASMLFHVTWSQTVAGDPKSYVESVSIMNARTAETVQGKLPIGFEFMDGSFLDGGLVVFMRPRNGDLLAPGRPGTVFRCSVAPFKCRPVVASVDGASMNEHGLVGTVTMIYNDRRNRYVPGWFAVPDKYVLNVLNVDGRILIRQELPAYSKKDLLSRALIDVKVHVSPSGRRVILEWGESKEKCKTDDGLCKVRKIFEFPRPK